MYKTELEEILDKISIKLSVLLKSPIGTAQHCKTYRNHQVGNHPVKRYSNNTTLHCGIKVQIRTHGRITPKPAMVTFCMVKEEKSNWEHGFWF